MSEEFKFSPLSAPATPYGPVYLPRPHGISTTQSHYSERYGGSIPSRVVASSSGFSRQSHATPDNRITESDFETEDYARPASLFQRDVGFNNESNLYQESENLSSYRTIDPYTGESYSPRYADVSEHIRNIELQSRSQFPVQPEPRQGNVGDENGTLNLGMAEGLPGALQTMSAFPHTPVLQNTSNTGSGAHPGHATFVQSGHHHVSSTITPTEAYKQKHMYVDPELHDMPPPPQPTIPLTGVPTPRLVTSQGIPFRTTIPIPQRPRS